MSFYKWLCDFYTHFIYLCAWSIHFSGKGLEVEVSWSPDLGSSLSSSSDMQASPVHKWQGQFSRWKLIPALKVEVSPGQTKHLYDTKGGRVQCPWTPATIRLRRHMLQQASTGSSVLHRPQTVHWLQSLPAPPSPALWSSPSPFRTSVSFGKEREAFSLSDCRNIQ